jgi:bifunctional DNA-binding transcriptional regulator/antitoxin component of YhaV-PrlF toxin-antitoxin module
MEAMHPDRDGQSPAPAEPMREQLLAALVPGPPHRELTNHPPLPALPAPQLPILDQPAQVQLGMARLDWSGRLHQRALLQTLGWEPGDTLELTVIDAAILITASPTGLHTLGPGMELTIPAAARRLCGITEGSRVLLAASPTQHLLVLHPETTITTLLCTHHDRLAHNDDHDR